MPQPTAGDVHVNVPLTNISIAYMQSAGDYVADKVFSNIPVQKQSDRYFTYDKRFWRKSEAAKRAPGAPSAGSGFAINSTPTYFADVWAIHKDVADQVRSNTDRPLDADRDATNWVTQQMLLAKEKEFANTFIKTGIWATDTSLHDSGTMWDANGSDPVSDIAQLSVDFLRQTGFRPNAAVMTPGVEQVLKNHSLILDRIKYTQRGIVTLDLLASLFDLQNLYTMQATEFTGDEPNPGGYDPADKAIAQTVNADLDFIGSLDSVDGKGFMLLLYVPPAPSILTPSAGYTFSWTGYMGAGALGGRIKRFRMEENASDRIEMEMAFDMKLVCADMGSLIHEIHG